MQDKKFTFAVSNRRKCIANLRTQPIHFREDFGKYRSQKFMNVIVYESIQSMQTVFIIFLNSFP